METNWECFKLKNRATCRSEHHTEPGSALKKQQMVQHADSEGYKTGNEGSELDWGRFIGSRRSSRSLADLVHHQHHISTKLNHKHNCLVHHLTVFPTRVWSMRLEIQRIFFFFFTLTTYHVKSWP